jgi:hypothetical protein
MTASLSRRSILAAGLALPLAALPGCSTVGAYGYEDAVRRLLTIASQRAFARLRQEGGFQADGPTRIALPAEIGEAVQATLSPQVNYAARLAAERAAPIVRDAIQSMAITDPAALFRGGATAATDLLKQEMGESLFSLIAPEVGNALRLGDGEIVDQALAAGAGLNFEGLRLDIARKASDGIYRAIAREEAAIRADPTSVGDLILRSALGSTNGGEIAPPRAIGLSRRNHFRGLAIS